MPGPLITARALRTLIQSEALAVEEGNTMTPPKPAIF